MGGNSVSVDALAYRKLRALIYDDSGKRSDAIAEIGTPDAWPAPFRIPITFVKQSDAEAFLALANNLD